MTAEPRTRWLAAAPEKGPKWWRNCCLDGGQGTVLSLVGGGVPSWGGAELLSVGFGRFGAGAWREGAPAPAGAALEGGPDGG
eukprot:CAMPEP_0173439102 /NCGR_PEP_ID=MMETSP1357-20121228/20770_1 /TAXON_ID=77926 /ORGANISM="Hemiselmis rufescens, Strain PCC563" /LENGTH=81 /DNA_ID=CAMNT_0014404437 /DNA_START=90 /DNA_END=336 /DNA_ORIENTATION=-